MSHLDDDLIAVAAIGDQLGDTDAAHLVECTACSGRVRELENLAARAAAVGRPEPLLVPSARVWEAIAAETGLDEAFKPESVREVPDAHADVEGASGGSSDRLATVTPIRRFAGWRVATAAAVGVVVGGVGVGLWTGRGGDNFTVVASAALTNLVTDAPAGTARVEDRPDGAQILVLDTTYTAPPNGDLEVWLIDPKIEGMVSLGFLASSHGEFVIPAGYSPSAYPIVDISVEPRDGVPTHSSDSITRGTLGF
jgi:hypothetical protein